MRVILSWLIMLFIYNSMYSQHLNFSSGAYIPYMYNVQPIYQSNSIFGINEGSSLLYGISYNNKIKNRLYYTGIDLYKGGLEMNWPKIMSFRTCPGIIIDWYFLAGKNLFRDDQRFFFIPLIGFGLQANHYYAKADAFFPNEIGNYHTIEVHHELFNRLQLVPQASVQFGIKIKRSLNFGMSWKFIYASKKIERFTYTYNVNSSPEPSLEHTAVTQTTGTGLAVNFILGIPLNERKRKAVQNQEKLKQVQTQE